MKHRIISVLIILVSVAVGYFIYNSEMAAKSPYKFKLGLDLSGGTHLVYRADVSNVKSNDLTSSMNALRDVIERRLNLFGVSEPLVQIEHGGTLGAPEEKLIVELPGVTDVKKAIEQVGKTPLLEFKLVTQATTTPDGVSTSTPSAAFLSTGLTGRLLDSAALEFDPQTGQPQVSLKLDDEGKALFAKITKDNVGRQLAIFLDGSVISSPVIREEIPGGIAQISGGFTTKEAQTLVRDLNYGALPVPIELVGTQTIGATLGDAALAKSVAAGLWAFLIIALFMIIWYRVPGLIATIALAIYTIINLALFKLLPGGLQITLTAAGIAAFILSVGMAVDANILIFERMKEELRRGKSLSDAMHDGFARAWLSIRDSNLSSIITAVILFTFASTAVIKGFALVFVVGVLTSMLTAISISRVMLYAVAPMGKKGTHHAVSKWVTALFSNGFTSTGRQTQEGMHS